MLKLDISHIKNRPSWDKYYLNIAKEVSTRSPDAETQHGAVAVNSNYEIVATGYNGHLRNVDNFTLPNLRPDKYPFMIHAEHNCILSCARQGKSTLGLMMYVTGQPCLDCVQYMYQAGIATIIYAANKMSDMITQDTNYVANLTTLQTIMGDNINIRVV